MDLRIFMYYLVSGLLWKYGMDDKEVQLHMKRLKNETDQLKLQLEKNSEMFHLNVGLAPNTVLSALSGSLFCHTLTFLVIFLLIHTCGGKMTSFNLSLLKSNTAPSADPAGFSIFFPPAAFYPILAFALVVTVVFILFAWYTKKYQGSESDMERGLLEDPSTSSLEDVTRGMTQQVMDAIKEQLQREEERRDVMMKQMKEKDDKMLDLVKKLSKREEILQREASVVNALKEQKKLLENQKDLLKSQLEEVERKKKENKENLLSVENKITEAERENKDKGGLLKENENLTDVKWKLEEQKTTLEKLKLNVEQLQQIIDALAGGDQV